MAQPAIPTRLLRLAEALVFASPRPATWRLLAPFLPAHLSTDDVFAALQAHCAERGVVLVHQAGGWVFRTAPDLNDELQTALGDVRKRIKGLCGAKPPQKPRWTNAVRWAAIERYGDFTRDAWCRGG